MKKIVFLITLFCLTALQAQQISDYRYISIPEKFSDFEPGQYQLNNYLRLLLNQKDYEVLGSSPGYWPDEARLNPCQVLTADISKVSSAFRNKVALKFRDCNETVVATFEGESSVKEFEEGYKDALNNAFAVVGKQANEKPVYRENEKKEVTIVSTTKTEHPGVELFKKHSEQPANPQTKETVTFNKENLQAFEYNGQTVYKSDLNNGEFTLIDKTKSHILASYYPSTQEGVYHVKVNSGNISYMTIGYFNGNDLSYEYTTDSKSWTLIKFLKQ